MKGGNYILALFCLFGICSCDPLDQRGLEQLRVLQDRISTDPGDRDAFDAIVKKAKGGNSVMRGNAIAVLGQVAQKNPQFSREVLSLLISVLKHNDEWDKRIAAEQLVELAGPGTTEAIPILTESLKAGNSDLGWFSAEALGNYGSLASSSAEALEKALLANSREENNLMGEYAARALGKINNPAASESLLRSLGSPNINVQLASVEALLKLGSPRPEVKNKLAGFLKDNRPYVKEKAERMADRYGRP